MFTKLLLDGSVTITVVALLTLFICWPVAIVRAAINDELSPTAKVVWIVAQFLFLFPISLLYMVAVDRSLVLKTLGVITFLFMLIVMALMSMIPSFLKMPPAPIAGSCSDELMKTDWYRQINARTDGISERLKQLGDKATQDPAVPLSQQIVYPDMREKLSTAETYLIGCRLSRDAYVKSLDDLEKAIDAGALNEDYVRKWDQMLPQH